MLNWIKGYVDRWTGFVATEVRDLVHWGLHALAGVVYTVFGNVGKAWHDLCVIIDWLDVQTETFAGRVTSRLVWLWETEIPRLAATALGYLRAAEALALKYYRAALAGLGQLRADARQWVSDAEQWVIRDVYDPLASDAKQLRADLLKWGYYAWQILTHPDQLAALAGDALISWAEAQFWRIASPVGQFGLRLVTANLRRVLQLTETIITAVL